MDKQITTDVPATVLQSIPLCIGDKELTTVAIRRTTSFQHVDKTSGAVSLRYNYEIIMDGMPSVPAVGGASVSRAVLRIWRDKSGKGQLYISLA